MDTVRAERKLLEGVNELVPVLQGYPSSGKMMMDGGTEKVSGFTFKVCGVRVIIWALVQSVVYSSVD